MSIVNYFIMMSRLILKFIFAITLCLGFVACSKDEDKTVELSIPQESTVIGSEGGTIVLKVVANITWLIEVNQNWASLDPSYGRGNTDVNLVISKNSDISSRTVKVTLKSGSFSQSVEITQEGNAVVPSPSDGSAKKWADRLEVPELKAGNILHPVVTYESAVADSVLTYIYEWDPNRLHIRWTAFYFDSYTSQKNWTRKQWVGAKYNGVTYDGDPWHDDMYLASSMRTTYDNHRGNGYDRGHMVASGDRLYSMAANYETYSYSNMSPQLAAFNQDYWVQLEDKVQYWGATRSFCDTLYVCKGATIDNDEDILSVVKSLPVPKYYYMAVMKIKDGNYSAAGFLMEHKTEGYSKNMSLKPFAMSIDELESKTGVNFFHNLPDDIETEIEGSYKEGDWF